jgi:hypothetical protein
MDIFTRPDQDLWLPSVDDELHCLLDRGTFTMDLVNEKLVDKSKIIPSKLIFDIKHSPLGVLDKYKSRLTAGGHRQSVFTYHDTFADTVAGRSLNLLIAVGLSRQMHFASLDVKTAFLYSDLHEEIYMRRPPGLTDKHMPALVRLRKCIYGLKQAANAWRKHLHDSLVSLGFHACVSDSCVYIKVLSDGSIIQLATHVDDVLIIASSQSLIQWFVDSMSVIYQIKVQNPLTSYLGMNISCDPSANTLTLNQPAYIQDLADKYASSISSEFPLTPMLPAPPEDPTPLTDAEQHL